MEQVLDGITIDFVDCDGYPSLRVRGASEEALDCLSDVRNLRARILDRKIFEMHNGFSVKYLMTDEGPAVGFTGPPPDNVIDCIAEVRNVKEDIMNGYTGG